MVIPSDDILIRAATIDELLSDHFEVLTGQKSDTDIASKRLAAWCRAAASGDWSLFDRCLERDNLTWPQVLSRFATLQPSKHISLPDWARDVEWVVKTLSKPGPAVDGDPIGGTEVAFSELFSTLALEADKQLWSTVSEHALGLFTSQGRSSLRRELIVQLSDLCADVLFDLFKFNKGKSTGFLEFLDYMRRDGWEGLFKEKPVLARLIVTIVRQWLNKTHELIERLAADMPLLAGRLLPESAPSPVTHVDATLSDPHNGGRSVHVFHFEDGCRLVYKPKDLHLDAAWQSLIEKLNDLSPPATLRSARIICRSGYGWSEFIDHKACADPSGFERFFHRAGAWLALFHVFCSTDMHDENMIASGEHPVPIDLEMILQPSTPEHQSYLPEREAFETASQLIADSVMMTGLLPAYGRSPENRLQQMGGLASREGSFRIRKWVAVNTDDMRRVVIEQPILALNNLPHFDGQLSTLRNHTQAFIKGYREYAFFLLGLREQDGDILFDGFADLHVRKVVRPTRFYTLLLKRLRDHRTMQDGVIWSAQASFVARLADWNTEHDPLWPLLREERSALLTLNVPHFTCRTDNDAIASLRGELTKTGAVPGLDRARMRFAALNAEDIGWQTEIIRQSIESLATPVSGGSPSRFERLSEPGGDVDFLTEADSIFQHVSASAIRRGPGAAWLGLDWLGDADVSQLVALRYDLYNGSTGIAFFLAAYARTTGDPHGRDLARDLTRAAIAPLRKDLHSPTAARLARGIGIGGASGLGSIVYALASIADFLADDEILADAKAAAGLFSKDLIAADKALDVIGGSAGAILGLLRLYRTTQSADVLARAVHCADHLLGQPKQGSSESGCWVGQGAGSQPLNGMSHGAAGFAYAFARLAEVTQAARFVAAAHDCMAFENMSFSPERRNWPDLRFSTPQESQAWSCQWCHGATGIGMARLGTLRAGIEPTFIRQDIANALSCAESSWPSSGDTLCCGNLGTIELLASAGQLESSRAKLASLVAVARSTGDYALGTGGKRFNLGLFRGLAGVGYSLLRQVNRSLPNVLLWE